MQSKTRAWYVVGGVLLCIALASQPLLALCGNCARNAEVLACYAYQDSNNACITVRCHVEGDSIAFPQRGYCCYDEMSCAF